jgi:hypothetical protein
VRVGRPVRLLAEADRFDVVAIGIEQEGGVIARTVVGAHGRLAVLAATDLESAVTA